MPMKTFYADYHQAISDGLESFRKNDVLERLWQHDHTLWKEDPSEISNRLGWLHCPQNMPGKVQEIMNFVHDVRQAGFRKGLLLGMGGSSLAPEVFRFVFGKKRDFPDLSVLDSTDPGAVRSALDHSDLEETLFVVSTKSGGTVETMSFMKYFYTHVAKTMGAEDAGNNFVAITDPGSGLENTAKELKFRKIFLNDPEIGGRYSVLSYFGLVPAALSGIDLQLLLDRASGFYKSDSGELGVAMGVLAAKGRDKLTLVLSPQIFALGSWIEQLIAESTGKEGKGILPVIESGSAYSDQSLSDSFIVSISMREDRSNHKLIEAARDAGHPVCVIELDDLYDLGKEFFRWEFATAIASWFLKINPFDQPNVESAKVQARKLVQEYSEKGTLPEPNPVFQSQHLDILSTLTSESVKELILKFFDEEIEGQYISIHAYMAPDKDLTAQLEQLKLDLRNKYKCAVTLGYGPRFLHSTGQLHKGDAGKGKFIQIINKNEHDIPIPVQAGSEQSEISFGVLKMAQALGDREALLSVNRQVISFIIKDDLKRGLDQVVNILS